MSLYKIYVYLLAVIYSTSCIAMELDSNFNVRSAFLKFNENKQITIKINDHLIHKTDFFKNFYLYDNKEPIVIEPVFDGLVPDSLATKVFIESLSKEYNVPEYFIFFNKNSVRNLYKMYTWYSYIAYAQMQDIICAVILVKACKLNLIHPKSYAKFTQCRSCTNKNTDAYYWNIFPLDNYHKQLAKKISNSIPEDVKKPLTEDETIEKFGENICKILDLCNTFKYNKDVLLNVLCRCQKIKNQDKITLKGPLEQVNKQEFSEELKKVVCQELKKYNYVEILYLTNLTLDNAKYIDTEIFLSAFDSNVSNVIFNNVKFANHYNKENSFLLGLRDHDNNNAPAMNVYLTGNKTVLTGPTKWSDIELSYKVLHGIYSKNKEVGYTIEPLIPATLFVDSESIDTNVQKKLHCNSIYYTQYYFMYNQLKRLLIDRECISLSLPLGSLADLVCSLLYNAMIAHHYGFDHFLVPIPLLVLTVINLLNTSCNGDEQATYTIRNAAHQKERIAGRNCYICIALIAAFYIYKEIKYKPSGWHTYSFFPWTTVGFYMALMYFVAKKNQDNYEEIKHGKVEFIKDFDKFY